jgi:hypothetical protein
MKKKETLAGSSSHADSKNTCIIQFKQDKMLTFHSTTTLKVQLINFVAGVNKNVALHQPTFQISTYPGCDASLAVDGIVNIMVNGACTWDDSNPWWAVDVGRPMFIRGINITSDSTYRKLSQAN